jgi:hypothetical protein
VIDFANIRFLNDAYQIAVTGQQAFSKTWPANLLFNHAISGWKWYEGCKKFSFFVVHSVISTPVFLFQKLILGQTGSEKVAYKISGALLEGRYLSSKISAILGKIFDLITSVFGILIPNAWIDYFCGEARELAKKETAKIITPLIDRVFYLGTRQTYSTFFDWIAWCGVNFGLVKGGEKLQQYLEGKNFPISGRNLYQTAGIVFGVSFFMHFLYHLYAGRAERDDKRGKIERFSQTVLRNERAQLLTFLDTKLKEHSICLSQARLENILQLVTDVTLDNALKLT